MKEHLKNGNALLAVSVIGLVAMLYVVYIMLNFGQIDPNLEEYGSQRLVVMGQIQVAFAIIYLAWFATLGLAAYDIFATSKNSTRWKVGWAIVNLFCFFGSIIYCLVGRRSRISNEAK